MDRFLTADQHDRAADLRACEEILEVLARVRRVKAKFRWFRQQSQTPSCDLLGEDWRKHGVEETDDKWDYDLLQSLSLMVVVDE